MNTSKAAVILNSILGKVLIIIGYVIGAFFLLGLIISIVNNSTSSTNRIVIFFMSSAFLFLAVLLIIQGSKIKKIIKRFKKYVGLISMKNMTSLDSIASSTSQSIDFVRNDIQRMIDKRFFAAAYIDTNKNEIVILNPNMNAQQIQTNYNIYKNTAQKVEQIMCSGCGANNLIRKGIASVCEFCGAPLKKV